MRNVSEKEVEQLRIEPLPATDPEIGRALRRLEGARGRLKEALAKLDPDWLDWEPYPGGNSVGTLLYHIAAIELDWLFCEVLEQEFSAEAQALLPYPVRDETGRLFPVTAVSLRPLAKIRYRSPTAAGCLCRFDFGRVPPGAPTASISCHTRVGVVSSHPARNRTSRRNRRNYKLE